MQIYPKPTKAEGDGAFIVLTFDIARAADGLIVARDMTASAPIGQLATMRDNVQDAMASWLVRNAFQGDAIAALNASINAYADADWRAWGI